MPRKPHLDWSKLPERLRYVAEVAEYVADYSHDRFHVRGRQQDAAERLETVARQIKSRGDLVHIHLWFERHLLHRHPEAACLDVLMGILDEGRYELKEKPTPDDVKELWRICPDSWFVGLAMDTRQLFEFHEGNQLVLDGMARLIPGSDSILALDSFPSAATLEWLDEHLREKVAESCTDPTGEFTGPGNTGCAGRIAALCGVRWPRLAAWLQMGEPYGMEALYALDAFWNYQTRTLLEAKPRLIDGPPLAKARLALQDHLSRDDRPKHRKLVEDILAHWSEITASP